MIQQQTYLDIADNTGAKQIMCIQVLKGSGAASFGKKRLRRAKVGDIIMASVNLAAAKIANVLLGWPIGQTLVVCGVINVAFAAWDGRKDASGDLVEKGSQKAVSSWWYFRAEEPPDYSGYLYAALAMGIALAFQFTLIGKLKKGQSA